MIRVVRYHSKRLFPRQGQFLLGSSQIECPEVTAEFLEFPRDPARSRHCAEQITRYLLPILAQRRREPRDDILSGLVAAEVDGRRLTDEEILAHIRLIFSAGASTTTDALGNLIYTLLEQPDEFDMHRDSSKKLLSLGPGPRLCPGMRLARRQLAVALDVILKRLPDGNRGFDPRARSTYSVCLIFRPRAVARQ